MAILAHGSGQWSVRVANYLSRRTKIRRGIIPLIANRVPLKDGARAPFFMALLREVHTAQEGLKARVGAQGLELRIKIEIGHSSAARNSLAS